MLVNEPYIDVPAQILEVRIHRPLWEQLAGVFRSIFTRFASAATFQMLADMEFLGRLG